MPSHGLWHVFNRRSERMGVRLQSEGEDSHMKGENAQRGRQLPGKWAPLQPRWGMEVERC